jgi:hypothetical protein
MIELARYKLNKETKEEEIVPLSLYIEDVLCLYRGNMAVFIVPKQGYMNTVPYELAELQEYLGL